MTETGIWSQEEANTGHAFSYRLAEYLATLFSKYKYVIDIGCGKATYMKYFRDLGFNNVVGIEGSELKDFEDHNVVIKDLSEPVDIGCMGNVMCIEVGEHIPAKYEDTFINTLSRHVKPGCLLVVSWAHEGQDGYGHVNCRPSWWVQQKIEARGFVLQSDLTERARFVCEGHVAYLKENLFIFKKS